RSAPAPINALNKSARAIIGNGDTMVLPDVPAAIFEGEARMAVIIAKRASPVSAPNAMDYVFGYTNFIDGSARGLPPPGNVFFQMKSRDTFAPLGPWIVTADEIRDPQKLQIRLWTNGQLMQNFNTDDIGHNIQRCIDWLTSIHTLEAVDDAGSRGQTSLERRRSRRTLPFCSMTRRDGRFSSSQVISTRVRPTSRATPRISARARVA